MPTGGGVCNDRWLCAAEASAVGAAVLVVSVLTAVWFARAKTRTFLAGWLMAASTHRLVWGVPVVGTQFASVSDLATVTTNLGWLYTRQVYVPVELALLNLFFYSCIMQMPATTYVTAAYWTASLWLGGQYWKDAAAPLYTLHDVGGLFLSLAWFYSGHPAASTPRRTASSASGPGASVAALPLASRPSRVPSRVPMASPAKQPSRQQQQQQPGASPAVPLSSSPPSLSSVSLAQA